MKFIGFSRVICRITVPATGMLMAAALVQAQAQKPTAPQNPPQAGTFRVRVGLVQTDVMVFDKEGHFIPDLKKEQFELRIDGKVQPIEFFEMVSAGSAHDVATWSKAEAQPMAAGLVAAGWLAFFSGTQALAEKDTFVPA